MSRHNRRNSLAKRRIEVLCRDLRLRQRIKVRVDDDDAKNWILVVSAVKSVGHSGKGLAIHHNLLAPLWIFTRSVTPAKLLRARQKQLQCGKVATRHRQILN